MFTYASLTQAIKDYTEQSSPEATFESQIPNFIRLAEERILKTTQLEAFQESVEVFWESGDRASGKPCDWLSTYALSIREDDDQDTRVVLQRKDKTFLDTYWPDYASTGTPRYYSDHDVDDFVLAPTPGHDMMAMLHYLRRPESLTTTVGGDMTWLSVNAPQALLYAALVEAYGFLKGEQEMMQFYDSRFMESISRLKNHGEGLEPDDSDRRGFIRTQPT